MKPSTKNLSIELPEKSVIKIGADTLIQGLENNPDEWLIIDVRDVDFDGGHIPSCLHIPFSEFEQHLNEVLEQCQERKHVVFYCMYSQQRGPSCASILASKLADTPLPNNSTLEINVLNGGFHEWCKRFKDDPHLVEGYAPEFWDENGVHVNDAEPVPIS
eukprot:gb/GECH01013375.1/.p1 GENE.gb/GECH01013375.1/~~gb/GECH01013375.1/.p1  ORF type:complete len:160 (+),score=44.38 gb/GECH01013375.1/:1-480(+)